MNNKLVYKLSALCPLLYVMIVILFAAGCSTFSGQAEYKNTVTYTHPEVNDADKIIFIVGAEGPNPLSFVRICTEDFKERVGKWTDHRIESSVQPGEVIIIEQPNWFPVRRLCAYSKDRYANYVGTHVISEIVYPGEGGPGIYYLGTVKTPDSVSSYKLNELYFPEITDTVRANLIEAVNAYPDFKPINFDIQ